jgi:hypothetical protein
MARTPQRKSDPTDFAKPSLAEARAVHAFAKGEATAEQQKQVFRWLLHGACGAGNEVLVPGQPDVTGYLSGRRSVSLQIGWVLGQPPEAFRKPDEVD